MSYVLSEGAMEKLIQDVADVRAGQAFLKQSVERMEEKLISILDEHDGESGAGDLQRQAARPLSLAVFLGNFGPSTTI